MTGRLLWLPQALLDAGLRVNVVGGWETRGRAAMHPRGLVLHHTASRPPRPAPSLAVCIDGRRDLPGPLCHVLIGRDRTCHVIASGVANHAGEGSWRGITGNASVIGIEVENQGDGSEPWDPELVLVTYRAAAACLRATGIGAAMVCGHKEWAPRRKVDPWGWDMDTARARIDVLAGNGDDLMAAADDILRAISDLRGETRAIRDETLTRLDRDHLSLARDTNAWVKAMASGGDHGADVEALADAIVAAGLADQLARALAERLAE